MNNTTLYSKQENNQNNNIAILGGTFDPIHNGHLKVANIVSNKLNIKPILFIPNKNPPHRKKPKESADTRLAMLRLALQDNNDQNFIANTSELERQGPSYMIDTIDRIKNQLEYKNKIVWLILGMDAFYNLPKWHNWEKLSTSCNFIVLDRETENTSKPEWIVSYLKTQQITDISNSRDNNGAVYFLDTDIIPISATLVRQEFSDYYQSGDITSLNNHLPKIVLDYILAHKLYKN